jgi:ABC-2 type transport system permease protein
MGDVRIVAWKEWRELLRMSGTRKSALVRHLFSVGVIAVLWPWQFGPSFLSPGLAVTLAALTAAMYVAGTAPDALAGERERHTLETLLASRLPDRAILLGKISALIEYGCAAAALMLILALITVNIVHGEGRLLMYSRRALLASIVLIPLAAGLVAAIGVHVSLRAKTVKQAQQTLSTGVLIVMFVPIIAGTAIGAARLEGVLMRLKDLHELAVVATGALVMLLAQLILFWWALVRFKRGRLIL